MLKTLSTIGVVAALALAPTTNAAPLIGGNGLTGNAWSVVNHIQANYPGVNSIGGVRACDWVGEHCAGRAVDIMVGGNTALGNTIHADLLSQRGRFGIKYILWGVRDHGDHLHVSVY